MHSLQLLTNKTKTKTRRNLVGLSLSPQCSSTEFSHLCLSINNRPFLCPNPTMTTLAGNSQLHLSSLQIQSLPLHSHPSINTAPSVKPHHRTQKFRMTIKMGKPGEVREPGSAEEFKLLGYSRFVRSNPGSDRFPVHSFHHVEFWTSDATTAASRFSFSLGLPFAAKSDLSTSNSSHCSFLLRRRRRRGGPRSPLSFLFTAPYPAGAGASGAAIPSFDAAAAGEFVSRHGGLAVRAIALSVADAAAAFDISVANGAVPAFQPTDLGRGFRLAEVQLYGDVVLRFVSGPDASVDFLPGFEGMQAISDIDYGLRSLDHAVGNVHSIAPVVSYVKKFLGFHEFAEFTAEDVGTAESGLNSVVLANNEETVLLPLNEPVHGTKRRSQIQTYLDHHGGPGVQHLALRSDDVIATVRKMKGVSGFGGFEFMEGPPPNYYEGVKRRAGDVLSEEQIRECQDLGLLVDRDDQGVLVQIFTKPIGDRYWTSVLFTFSGV